ncbi:MAG TPA: beta-N-acetylhexosaminidase [Terrimesophilobacter sp.]|uniref:beta-N-acetylhexosaminidase n=1 Tax=Terrimesophilobacter sp. TaxID=2906435 RepID=UPI002F91E362
MTRSTAPPVTGTVVPVPVSQVAGSGSFVLGPASAIAATGLAVPVAEYLVEALRPVTGSPLPIGDSGDIVLAIEAGHPPEGYALRVAADGIRITADAGAGLFWGVQTLRQLVPPATSAPIPATTIEDHPRFAYRGAMLDVARHFFGVDDVKRYIDELALLKLNVLHLHLSDDQGWRLQIDEWPRLTEHGGSTQVGGGGGGFYTKDDYRAIVAHAASRFVTVVPEIDMPGHTNAALASYPDLSCDGTAPALYEGIEVGFSSLCIGKERSYEFVEDVVTELVELTPGPWIHIGGDESLATPEADFLRFVERASAIVAAQGKIAIGWHEMGRSTNLPAGTIGEYWSFTTPRDDAAAVSQSFIDGGGKLIMAPADVAYLDMKYDESSPLGLVWANGPTSVKESYLWDPADILPGVGDESILGVEAPLWTETIATLDEVEFMAFPRLAAIAEIAWSPRVEKNFEEFAGRLAAFGERLDALGIRCFRAPEVPWYPRV